MKLPLLLLVLFLLFAHSSFAAFHIKSESESVPEYLKVEYFLRLSPAQFEKLSGHKLGFIQRTYFKKLQRQLSKSKYNAESNILGYYNTETGKFKLDGLWFILGCFIGPFAVLFSYTTRSNQTRNKHISALIGFGVFVIWFGWLFLF